MTSRRLAAVVLAVSIATVGLPAPPAPASSWPTHASQPLPVSTIGPRSLRPVAVSDGAGGAFVVWDQFTGGQFDVRAQHLLADGTRDPGWPAAGIAVCAEVGDQLHVVAAPDGAGGFLAAWEDHRTPAQGLNPYVTRITAAGTVAPGWSATGTILSTSNSDERDLAIVADGAGGAYVAWELVYAPGTDYDIYAARVGAGGTVAYSMGLDGQLGLQLDLAGTTDGAGGAIFAWRDDTGPRILAQRLDPAGVVWLGGNRVVATAAASLYTPRIASDDAGGAFVAWAESSSPNQGMQRAQRIDASGNPVWGSPTTGSVMLTIALSDLDRFGMHDIAPDGAGGFYLANVDGASLSAPYLLRVLHQLPSGYTAPGWPGLGVNVFGYLAVSLPYYVAVHLAELQPDGAGGVYAGGIVVDYATGQPQARLVRLTAGGAYASGWGYDGLIVGNSTSFPSDPTLTALSGGHALMAWESEAGDADAVLLANRVDRFGYVGDPAPAIASVNDVANDQGGSVRVSWTRSHLDADPDYLVGAYRVWKQVPAAAAALRLARGEAAAASLESADLRDGALVAIPSSAGATYWELAGTQVAQALPGYSMTVATAGDSTATGNPATAFMVTALHAYLVHHWNSAPDSGYSVDNLAPPTPSPFTGTYGAGSTALHWTHSPAPDFHAFRLYRGAVAGFEPNAGTFVVETTDTGYVDVFATPRHYKLVAVDVHGNASGAALVSPESQVGVADPAPATIAFAPPAPNPARGACELAFALPSAARVRVTVHDARGRLVRVVADGEHPAGSHRVTWRGDDANGRDAGSGLFFARLEALGRTWTRKLVRTR